MIYFIRDPAADRVKIGVSNDPWKRLKNMQTGSPGLLELVAMVDGDPAAEKALHQRFDGSRVRGEWFVWSGPVADHVATLPPSGRPSKPETANWRLRNAVIKLGYSQSYSSQLVNGHRAWPFVLSVLVWRECGQKVGKLALISDADLAKLASHFTAWPARKAA